MFAQEYSGHLQDTLSYPGDIDQAAGWGREGLMVPDPGIEPGSPALQADSLPSEPPGKPVVTATKELIITS